MFAAMEGYVARAVTPLVKRIRELEAKLDAVPAGQKGSDGKDAVVDYDHLGELVVLAVAKEVAKIPPAKDGSPGVVDYAIVKEFVNAAAINAVAAIPKPENGKDAVVDEAAIVEKVLGRITLPPPIEPDEAAIAARVLTQIPKPEPGRDGKSVEASEVKAMVESLVAARFEAVPPILDAIAVKGIVVAELGGLPKVEPVDEDAIVERVLARIPAVKDGEPGRDADEEAIVAKVLADVVARVDAWPRPRDGRDFDPDVMREAIDSAVTAAVKELPPAEPGKSVDPSEVAAMVDEAVTKAVVALPPPQPGEPGKSVAREEVEAMVAGEVFKAVNALPPPREGRDAIDGLTGIDAEYTGDRMIEFRFARSSGVTTRLPVKLLGLQLYQGVYEEGREYERGDQVTRDGSQWTALRDTKEAPGTSARDWKLSVKKGRDGRDR